MEVKTLKVISSYCYPGKTGISFTGTETKGIAIPVSRSGNDDYFMFEGWGMAIPILHSLWSNLP